MLLNVCMYIQHTRPLLVQAQYSRSYSIINSSWVWVTTDGQSASRPVCLGIKHPSRAYYQIFIPRRQLQVCWCGARPLTRGRVCPLQFVVGLASAVILGCESRGTLDHILLSQIRDFLFRLLLRLTGLRWRYCVLLLTSRHGSHRKQLFYFCVQLLLY
jgi:hypothetical protein